MTEESNKETKMSFKSFMSLQSLILGDLHISEEDKKDESDSEDACFA